MMPEAVFSSRYAGSVGYYAAMLHFRRVAIDISERYDKKAHALNRMDIIGTNGLQKLSVPLSKPNSSLRIADIELSEHGNWRHNHWGALFSAYGRTPFFEYFADDLKNIYEDSSIKTIAALNLAIHFAVVDFLELDIETVVMREKMQQGGFIGLADMRKCDFSDFECGLRPYYQIWQQKHGFQSGQSILDLLFNEGREAVFHLLQP